MFLYEEVVMNLIKSGIFASLVLSAVMVVAAPVKNPTPSKDELVSQFYQSSKEVKNNLEKILKSKDYSAFCAARGDFLTAVQDFSHVTKLIGIPTEDETQIAMALLYGSMDEATCKLLIDMAQQQAAMMEKIEQSDKQSDK